MTIRLITLAIIVATCVESAAAKEIAYLDLTGVTPRTELRHPPAPRPKCDSSGTCTGSGFGSVSIACGTAVNGEKRALRASLMSLDQIEYLSGDRAEIEVQLENVGEMSLEIPWSPHLADLQPVDDTSKFHANSLLIGLFLHWGEDYSTSLGWIYLYGSPTQKESMLTLHPGEWVRVRGPIEIELDHSDGFVLPPPGVDQTATAEFEFRQVEYTPVAGGVGLSITNISAPARCPSWDRRR